MVLEGIGWWLLMKVGGTAWKETVETTRQNDTARSLARGLQEEIQGALDAALATDAGVTEGTAQRIRSLFEGLDASLRKTQQAEQLRLPIEKSKAEQFFEPIAALFHRSSANPEVIKEIAQKTSEYLQVHIGAAEFDPSLPREDEQVAAFARCFARELSKRLRRRFPQASQGSVLDHISSRLEEIAERLAPGARSPDESANPDFWSREIQSIIDDRTRGFVGRRHVFDAFGEFLEAADHGYFTLLGDPGEGKTAILAEYARNEECLVHFNVANRAITRPEQFLSSLAAQLNENFHVELTRDPEESLSSSLSRWLRAAAETLGSGERLVVVLDALDEVQLHGSGLNVLSLPRELPLGVFFFMSCRRLEPPLVPFLASVPQRIYDLLDYPQECERDILDHLSAICERPSVASWIRQRELDEGEFIRLLADRSERNFMYLRHVVDQIENGAYEDLSTKALPTGLQGFYEDHWRRMGMTRNPRPRDRIFTLYFLCEIAEPISLEELSRPVHLADPNFDAVTVQAVLNEWRPFLHHSSGPTGTRYSLYHTSFRDFLHRRDIVRAAGVSIAQINGLLADAFMGDLDGPGLS